MKALYAPVAQLDRVTGYEPVGRGFESLPAYQKELTFRSALSFCTFGVRHYQKIQLGLGGWNHEPDRGILQTKKY